MKNDRIIIIVNIIFWAEAFVWYSRSYMAHSMSDQCIYIHGKLAMSIIASHTILIRIYASRVKHVSYANIHTHVHIQSQFSIVLHKKRHIEAMPLTSLRRQMIKGRNFRQIVVLSWQSSTFCVYKHVRHIIVGPNRYIDCVCLTVAVSSIQTELVSNIWCSVLGDNVNNGLGIFCVYSVEYSGSL